MFHIFNNIELICDKIEVSFVKEGMVMIDFNNFDDDLIIICPSLKKEKLIKIASEKYYNHFNQSLN